MRKSRFSEAKIIGMIKEQEADADCGGIPAISALEKLIAETPEGQEVLLVSELDRPLTARWASNQITKWRREAQIQTINSRLT